MLCPLTASAQDVPTVRIGQGIKKTVGTVTATSSGDVACYLSLKDDRGVAFEEMAKFEICDQKPSIKGKRVSLTYALQNVMSDECQGNPDCKKSRTVAVVSAARIVEAPAAPASATSRAQRRAAGKLGESGPGDVSEVGGIRASRRWHPADGSGIIPSGENGAMLEEALAILQGINWVALVTGMIVGPGSFVCAGLWAWHSLNSPGK